MDTFQPICARCIHEEIDSSGRKPNPQCAEGHDCMQAMQTNQCQGFEDAEDN